MSTMEIGEYIPPLAQKIIDKFELRPTDVTPPKEGERATHGELTLRLFTGTAHGIDDGYDFAEIVANEFRLKPNANYGSWPIVMEWFKVHDPVDDPDETGRWFVTIRLTYLERSLYLALYPSIESARSEAWPMED